MNINSYQFLKQKAIIDIFIGDTEFGTFTYKTIDAEKNFEISNSQPAKISMPYLTGKGICDIATHLGFPMQYSEKPLSRRQYFENMLDWFIQNERCSDLLSFLFNKSQFAKQLKDFSPEEFNNAYNHIVHCIFEQVNKELLPSNHELKILNNKIIVQKLTTEIAISSPCIKKIIDRTYINDIRRRALHEIESGNFDSAITKSRTLLEEIFMYVIEKFGLEPSTKSNITTLYNIVKTSCNMQMHKDNDRRINDLLSGLEKIVNSIAELRNKNSDAHGLGKARDFQIKDCHARLLVNSSITMAEFILSVAQNTLDDNLTR